MKSFAEFFAGVGLVREGLAIDAWECVWANDISQDKKDTYVENYGDSHFCLGDIWDVVDDDVIVPGGTFLYTASFPCTDLSVAGARAGLAGKESGTLEAFLAIVENKKKSNAHPQIIQLENVKGFLTSHKGQDVVNTVKRLSELDYYVDIVEVDASYFTPQSRPRVFVIAVEKSLAPSVMKIKDNENILDNWWAIFDEQPKLRSSKIKNAILKDESLNWALFDITLTNQRDTVLADIIETEIELDSKLWWSSERKEHIFNQMSPAHQEKLIEMTSNNHFSYGTVFRRMRKGQSMAELRTDGLAGCLRTPRGGSSKQILIQAGFNDWNVRLVSPREYARLQGVRDSFILPENQNKGFFAMGDAVCVPVIEFLATEIITPAYNAWCKISDNKSC
ncbi:DNA (cytosine-5-)-methyltransferase [Vibrio sp. 99-70-13A1]|uniref:DNA cytosine methyltransferase n=1 Tax=Vibrio sp. 99-70-13A1 TaxID=2607601 RepID=UPI001493649B|nr:DNA (cytosine-5-)-methyltransferase [Vibrio sp. 99-70-13A1]NOH96286.1 DNA cytosine methyltransferase [Vibrio sp. 99-70-13A1]